MKRLAGLCLLLVAVALPGGARPRARYLTILHCNDTHGYLEPWLLDGKSVGGFARIAGLVKRIRRENAARGRATIFLEAGDVLLGTPQSMVFGGEPDVLAFNRMGLDAMTIGNHEFDFGRAVFARLVDRARFPIVSANIFTRDGHLFRPPTTILTPIAGLRVGVIGLTTADTAVTTFPTNVADLVFDDPVATARHVVPLLELQCDVVVALTHIGSTVDRQLARAVPGIDVVIGGHDQIPLFNPERVGNAVICQAQDRGLYLGRVDLRIEGERVIYESGRLIPIDSTLADDPEVAWLVASFLARLRPSMERVEGTAAVRLDGERATGQRLETGLGSLIADLMRTVTGADVALLNSGGVRGSIDAGPVTVGAVLTALPFDNKVVVIKVPGRVIGEALQRSASAEYGKGGFLQVSGLTCTISAGSATDISVGGTPLEAERTYTLALPDFLLAGGDGYALFEPYRANALNTGHILNALLLDALRGGTPLQPPAAGRIRTR
jgi:2',3'-cyclic-nucleotide 2'-phosphodiesterase (5'-nucleotidase family)